MYRTQIFSLLKTRKIAKLLGTLFVSITALSTAVASAQAWPWPPKPPLKDTFEGPLGVASYVRGDDLVCYVLDAEDEDHTRIVRVITQYDLTDTPYHTVREWKVIRNIGLDCFATYEQAGMEYDDPLWDDLHALPMPSGIAVHPGANLNIVYDDTLYVTDTDNHRILKMLGRNGRILDVVSGHSVRVDGKNFFDTLCYPVGIDVATWIPDDQSRVAGRIFVVDNPANPRIINTHLLTASAFDRRSQWDWVGGRRYGYPNEPDGDTWQWDLSQLTGAESKWAGGISVGRIGRESDDGFVDDDFVLSVFTDFSGEIDDRSPAGRLIYITWENNDAVPGGQYPYGFQSGSIPDTILIDGGFDGREGRDDYLYWPLDVSLKSREETRSYDWDVWTGNGHPFDIYGPFKNDVSFSTAYGPWTHSDDYFFSTCLAYHNADWSPRYPYLYPNGFGPDGPGHSMGIDYPLGAEVNEPNGYGTTEYYRYSLVVADYGYGEGEERDPGIVVYFRDKRNGDYISEYLRIKDSVGFIRP